MVLATFRRFAGTPTYLTDASLDAGVNSALALERPLLVAGESGTGKTQLAQAIAESLSLDCIHWPVKSTSRAQDGLYVLYPAPDPPRPLAIGADESRRSIRLGPLGRAFSSPRRVTLLIDEIDKADRTFPNDLLHELDRMRFVVPETGDEIVAVERPVVVITSNGERPLPDAFLRRCVFHFIQFPDRERMKGIVRVHHPHVDDTLIDEAVETFYRVRDVAHVRKAPSTSELVDWITVLLHAGFRRERLVHELPFLGVLLKNEQDLAVVRAALRDSESHAVTQLRPARGR